MIDMRRLAIADGTRRVIQGSFLSLRQQLTTSYPSFSLERTAGMSDGSFWLSASIATTMSPVA
jgi:hypothetical protein